MILRFIIYLLSISFVNSQGIDFPDEPIQAPIGNLWPLVLIGFLFILKRLKQIK
tara:strand:+ start:937 stop:1098 length:162 start_codon:yes stop_codon:yes gene_type:complete